MLCPSSLEANKASNYVFVPARIMFGAALAARQAEPDERDSHDHRHDRPEGAGPCQQERGSDEPCPERDIDEAESAGDTVKL